ncbi:MAG: LPS assembly protein LptD [Gammaproteobacteria bacterium]|nr:LPS assembly protein LptD [Gammaproteobacteria bacterium]MBU1654731.1 LPS assembly protein LptD [Gammaproteobacteria bacterium]MBU1959652.1 LPS assembly protein LptD [Gammaproteobacteria bacterium]
MSKKKILTIIVQGLLALPWGAAVAQGASWDCAPGGMDWNCSDDKANEAVTYPLLAENAAALPSPEKAGGAGHPRWTDLNPSPKVTNEVAANADRDSYGTGLAASKKAVPQDNNNQIKRDSVSVRSQAQGDRYHRLDEGLSWQSCGVPIGGQTSLLGGKTANRDLDISSDAVSWQRNDQIALFTGDVEVHQEDQHLESDWLRYTRSDGKVSVKGNFLYQSPSLRLLADEGEFYLNEKRGSTTGVKGYRILENGGRGTADKVVVLDSNHSHHENITYTTCRPGNSDWYISADELEINNESGWGEAKDATLRFLGTPILYAPYFKFPVDDRRMSGFLTPSVASSNKTGIDVTAPYYLNLAPNYDATLYPRIMSDRGLMLGGEFRFLTDDSAGLLGAEILPDDAGNSTGTRDTRGSLALRYTSNPAPRWSTRLYADYASDDTYLTDFGSNLGVTSAVNLERTAEASYSGDFWSFVGRFQDYQTIDNSIAAVDKPYSRLPQLLLNMEKPDPSTGLTYHFLGEYTHFYHENAVFGQRLDLMPGVSYPILRPWGHMIPKISGRYTAYALKDQAAGMSDNPDRALPVFSLDSGLVFERSTDWLGQAAVQTLEPRLFYLFTPEENQDGLPVFDTTEYGLSFDSLFRENRFSGADRQADANQLTAALTSRFFSESTGREWLSLSLGEVFYFEDRNVQLPGAPAVQDGASSMVAELSSNFAPDWYTSVYYQWNPHVDDTEKTAAMLRYKDEEMRVVNLAYRYEVALQDQVDASFHWPVSAGWSLVGRWNYSMRDEKTLDRFGGFEYNSCCWAFRFVGRHFVNNDQTTTGVFAQLELTGLGAIGQSVDKLIEEGVLGYEVRR